MIFVLSFSVSATLPILPLIPASIGPRLYSLAVLLIILPLPFITSSIAIYIFANPMHLTIFPFAIICITIIESLPCVLGLLLWLFLY